MNATKTDARTLKDIPSTILGSRRLPDKLDAGLYSYQRDDLQFDYLFKPVDTPSFRTRLVVLFSGAIDRERLQPPVFQRWTWAPHYDAHVLFIADPSLRLSDNLNLGWYFGTPVTDATAEYATLIAQLAVRLGIADEDIILYGSSGGGFAALQALRHLPRCAAVAINPQVRLRDYHHRFYDQFVTTCIGDASVSSLKSRLDLLECVAELRASRIVLAQNTLDVFHLDKHFAPFVAAMRVVNGGSNGLLREFLFENEAGHGAGEQVMLVPELLKLARAQALDGL